jgi:hypothetical protein
VDKIKVSFENSISPPISADSCRLAPIGAGAGVMRRELSAAISNMQRRLSAANVEKKLGETGRNWL